MQQSSADDRAERQYQNDLAARTEQRAYDRDALVRLVTDAEKAGFNPLTVLRNGGTAQFNSGTAPLSKQEASGEYMGAAVSKVGDFLANFDPFADDKREQESRLIESQIAALNAGGLSGVKHGRGNFASGDFDVSAPRKVAGLSSASVRKSASSSDADEIKPLYTKWRDPDGKIIMLPNPDLPDLDQLAVPPIGNATNDVVRWGNDATKAVGGFLSRPSTPGRRAPVDQGWKPPSAGRGNWRDRIPQ